MRVDAAGMTTTTAPSQLIETGTLTALAPFDFRRSLAFLAGFPPCAGEFVLRPDGVTTAFTVGGRAVAIDLTAGDASDRLDYRGYADAPVDGLVPLVRRWLSLDDDLTPFLAAVATDELPYRRLAARLHGLHHVRFRSVVEGCSWFVISQRTPQNAARALQRRIRDAAGPHVTVDGHRHVAFPSLTEILALGPDGLGELLRNARKGEYLHGLLSAVDRLGEDWLRDAPYAEAYAALKAVRGVGEFTASAVMLRALGRMDGPVPPLGQIAEAATAVYGHPVDPREIERRYGVHTGYWSYYLKAGYSRT